MSGPIVNLGLPKSGTTTLGHALKLAGLRTADYRIRPRQTDDEALAGAFVGELMYRGYFDTGDPLALLGGFTAFSEISLLRAGHSVWPQMDWGLIDAIRAHHPGVRFLASWRPPEAMSESMARWNNLGRERLPRNAVPGLPQGFGATGPERVRWIEGHYAHLDRLFAGDPVYLRYDSADPAAPARIGGHVGCTLPWWGRANADKRRETQG